MNVEVGCRGVLFGWLLALGGPAVDAADWDAFKTERQVSATASGALTTPDAQLCAFPMLDEPLTLIQAVERALCNNTQTRQAWARVKFQAAGVGVAKAAYLPMLNGSLQEVRDHSNSAVDDQPELSSHYRSRVTTAGGSLSWVLFDFGGRDANMRNATNLLVAAQSDHDATLQTVFATVAKDYCAAQAGQGAVAASTEIEVSARESFNVASERVSRGVSPISDALQAQTALAQATLNLAKANGDWQIALGVLASDMSLRPDATLHLPPVDEGAQAGTAFLDSVSELITRAEEEHPAVLAASAQLRAAEAKVDQTRAEGAPSVSLVAKMIRNNQPVSPSLGLPQLPANSRDLSLGLQITVPFFEGFARGYEVRQANAQVELQRVALDRARSQVGLDVWTSYAALRAATQTVANSAKLLELAQTSQAASADRYRAGVGGILELLSAQSVLAGARRQRLQALADWQAARLQLAGHLGRLGPGSL